MRETTQNERGISEGYPNHECELKRLNRVHGQIEGIRRMIEEHRYCPDIITQLRAVRAAVHAIEANVLQSHLEDCVTQVLLSEDRTNQHMKIKELITMFKRFD